ncbi:Predicted Fe-Mo cluster-binding protein, NifX family [Caldanaerobius fijiensis DSM 17918]|uniref:Predicted Fe-Mo cluster-binding protein, NifX family n=1 Tax=Caldanaerobius fijiensis DSM 17918 TaxID=1121256 RepID=A0A1M5D227_9THEO|nr:NifB/NifX family molybdenum-iron cluster-binding protein [Caldanaerobius fijiensis]SHF60964.1 Predicted Fe-Mo cluster-binding protein, NifX family [Caldanaerobius fijiensis DSM 17918]
MKIAIASDGNFVSQHFGHCEGFTIYEIEGKQIITKNFIENPGHRPGYLPQFLKDLGVNVIIAGGMGDSAQKLFAENGIEVIVGVSGICDDVIQQYLKDELKSTGSICKEHRYEGRCGD